MENNLDWINVMAFDFGAPTWKPNLIEAPAALYNPFSEVSGDSGISSWIRAGFPARKIVFGLPYYGYAWKLKDANNHGFLAPANGADITADGALGYTHIRNRIIGQGGAITAFNYTFASDYCYNGTTWVGYDDVKSILAKVLYAKAPANGADITADGALGYTHIRNRIIGQGGAITAFNYTFASDYCYNGTTWVGYDDVKSILAKVLYAKGKGLLGYFTWRVGLDDNWTLSKTV
nr:putative chitinase 3 [Quercus suber]